MSCALSIDDICRLRLPEYLLKEFLEELMSMPGINLPLNKYSDSQESIVSIINSNVILENYKDSVEYILASSSVERARVAAEAKIKDKFDEKVVKLWLKYAGRMIDMEKIMQGWDKL